ncbi:MAG: hypothetical protein GF401_09950 [Chitinivibrionales bacterium]|nr:hypothetical protein [Chitinivibrionales bacterium]
MVMSSIRVKLLHGWPESRETMLKKFRKMTRDGNSWNDIILCDHDPDYYVILNYPQDEYYDPDRTLIFQMEPEPLRKEWGEFYRPDKKNFLYVFDVESHRNVFDWWLSSDYKGLKKARIVKSKTLSTVTSNKTWPQLPGHTKRLQFLEYLKSKIRIDHFGFGFQELHDKETGMFPYKYTIAAENCIERNYFTEKLLDSVLAECLCFYWGCPNVADFIDDRVFIRIDIDDYEKSTAIIQKSIQNKEWENRIDAIRQEKVRVLDELSFFPTLEQVLKMPEIQQRTGV